MFSGLVFYEGADLFPQDIPTNLDKIRQWAIDSGLISDPDFQFISDERYQELSKAFSPKDNLQIALAIHDKAGDSFYLEYPYMPVKTLIQSGITIGIMHWKLEPTRWDKKGVPLKYGEVRFSFQHPNCYEEIVSTSTGKNIVPKFISYSKSLPPSVKIKKNADGIIEVNELPSYPKAKFFKEGRAYQVTFLD